MEFLHHLFDDIRLALRQLRKRPGFTLIVLLTLGLGTGATTTCYSLLSAVALRPLPFPDPERLVSIFASERGGAGRGPVTFGIVPALSQPDGVLSSGVAYTGQQVTLAGTAAGDVAAERVQAAEVAGDLFGLLGVPLHLGRSLRAEDAGTPLVVIGYDAWVRRHGSSRAVIGQPAMIDGELKTIVGVAGAGFSFPGATQVWMPRSAWPQDRPVELVARLTDGVSLERADAALRTVTEARPGGGVWSAASVSLRDTMVSNKHRNAALSLLVVSAFVLVVACANLGGLLLAYVGARRHEMALRSAIGASRIRLVRQLLTESVVLAVAGSILGALLAHWSLALFVASVGLPREAQWLQFTVDARVLAFALGAALLTALLFGVIPAIRGSRVDLRAVLQEDERTSTSGPGARRVRAALVAVQVALSLGLVAGASSIVMSALALDSIEPGFNRERLLAVRVALAGTSYDAHERRTAFLDAAAERLRAVPHVAAVAAVSHVPLGDRDVPFATFRPDHFSESDRHPVASLRSVSSNYMEMMDIPLRRGRVFTAAEARDPRTRLVVINDTMARRYWADADPIGRRLRITGTPELNESMTVIGVVGAVAQRQLPAAPEDQIYLPLAQARDVTLVVRALSDPAALAATAREVVRGVDPTIAISTRTIDDMYAWYVNDRQSQGVVLAAIGLIALLVAALGVYGAMALMVTERAREIAIRVALGCSSAAVRRLVLGRGLKLASVGIGAGVLLAMGITAFLATIFYGVRSFDIRILGLATALLGGVAIAASWWPARHAARVNPMTLLKS